MQIWVTPAWKGQFWWWFGGIPRDGVPDGVSVQPLLDGARKALAIGHNFGEKIELWHEGGTSWALRSTVAEAARLRVEETGGNGPPRFRKWKPFTLDRK
jgi:hypothetical protein